MLTWSSAARKTMSAFFIKWNDIDVYVEDTAKYVNSLYVALLNRAMDGKCKVENVYPVGNRSLVLDACARDQIEGGRPRIYLIDGDLDLVANVPTPSLSRLHSHHVYAVENYLFCQRAIITILHEENPKFKIDEIERIFDFNGFWMELAPIAELFVWFGMTRIIDPSLPTIKIGIAEFYQSQQSQILDPKKITTFCTNRKNELLTKCSQRELEKHEERIRNGIKRFPRHIDVVAAREFLFPVLKYWVQKKEFKFQLKNDSLFIRLAKAVDMQPYGKFLEALKTASTK